MGGQSEVLLINISRKGESEFELNPSNDSSAPSWTLAIRSSNSEDSALRNIAELFGRNDQLAFRWLPDADELDRHLLMGNLLRVSSKDKHQFFGFREPLKVDSLRIDFDKKRDLQTWEVNPPPNPEHLEARFDNLQNWSYGARFVDGKQSARIGRTATIEFEQVPGAYIEIRFISPRENALALMITPVFRENAASEVEMTKDRLQEAIKGYQKAIPVAQAQIVARRRSLAALQSIDRSNLNPADQLRLAGRINQLQEQIGRDVRELAETEARLNAAPKLQAFLSELDDKGEIKFRIVTTLSGEVPIALIDGGGGQPSRVE